MSEHNHPATRIPRNDCDACREVRMLDRLYRLSLSKIEDGEEQRALKACPMCDGGCSSLSCLDGRYVIWCNACDWSEEKAWR